MSNPLQLLSDAKTRATVGEHSGRIQKLEARVRELEGIAESFLEVAQSILQTQELLLKDQGDSVSQLTQLSGATAELGKAVERIATIVADSDDRPFSGDEWKYQDD
jgi:hypothetical protein